MQGWSRALGFSQIGVAPIDLKEAEPGLLAWLAAGFHGDMDYMAAHGLKRARPAELVPGTVSVLSVRMEYLPADTPDAWQRIEWHRLQQSGEGYISLYARGRDYHKVLRTRLQHLADRIQAEIGPFGYRCFTDSAPLLEVELATRAGLGWRGKHTLTLQRDGGSMAFLGEILLDFALPPSTPAPSHCGTCQACLEVCPTRAIVAPYRVDARRCISYLTIEHDDDIPESLRPLMGNRIYGCDDCQLACPWNKFAHRTELPDFDPRPQRVGVSLLTYWGWDEPRFLSTFEGSPIRRIGYTRWRRNLAVAAGNALRVAPNPDLVQALLAARDSATDLVRRHIDWAVAQGDAP
ncbi:tRNA epoxyqueuosine(34) reductase QueG [Inhella gelatinilytica]|uniref:tRNA epoxyqueuosine(34) reductase QueG n=1 Tax=Inhella gelatinilytica TaxID=2795030 RepID=UPI00287333E2|nr:tRNA epoxyqueuosine(34) reductase QueG [Inhella gelatinilytica]